LRPSLLSKRRFGAVVEDPGSVPEKPLLCGAFGMFMFGLFSGETLVIFGVGFDSTLDLAA
jgi:hypothetical protein